MYNVKKCPKCGGNVPEGNSVCYNCGNKMKFFGGNSVIVGGSSNTNTIPGGNPFESKKKSSSGCLPVFLILIFFILPVFSVIYEVFQEFSFEYDDYNDYNKFTCNELCVFDTYNRNGNFCMCSNGDIFNEESGMRIIDRNTKCSIYCDNSDAFFDRNKCVCPNGEFIDINGNKIENTRSVSEWLSDVKSGKDVVTLLCDSKSKFCPEMKLNMEELHSRKEFNYYYFNLDALTASDLAILTDTYYLNYYETSDHFVPYLFVIRNDKFTYQLPGVPSKEHIESFLISNGVIQE